MILLEQLNKGVLQLESGGGTLWSEDAAALGLQNRARFALAEACGAHEASRRLHGWVANLPLTAFERSFKMLYGQLDPDRFLVGLPSAALSAEDADELAGLMGAPPALRALMRGRLAQAGFLHVGFEHSAGRSNYKLYHEYADSRLPRYIGYKWDAQQPHVHAESSYVRQALPTLAAMLARMQALQPDVQVCAGAQAIVRQAAQRVAAERLVWVDVSEQSTPRRSFDINLYASELRLAELGPLLGALAAHMQIPGQAMAALLSRRGTDTVGHVSSGTDRHGRPFLTVYHGRDVVPD